MLSPVLRAVLPGSVLFLAACSAPPTLHPSEDPSLAPHPYTPEAIAERCTPGTTLVYDVRNLDQLVQQRMEFVEADERGAVVETTVISSAGHAIGEPVRNRASWSDLRDHASYPADATEVLEVTCAVPAGEFDCWLYRVSEEEGETRAWFSKHHPGPPVRMEMERGGRVTYRMELAALEESDTERAGG